MVLGQGLGLVDRDLPVALGGQVPLAADQQESCLSKSVGKLISCPFHNYYHTILSNIVYLVTIIIPT